MAPLLSHDPLDAAAIMAAVADAEHGGTAVFVGTTRAESGLRAVTAIDYEAYEQVALTELAAIVDEAHVVFGARLALAHRLGRVGVGEPSVVVVASAPHRPAAFGACRYGIDELKSRAPIWKRTVFADGGARWIDGCDREVARSR